MPRKLVEGVVFGHLFTFLPTTRASQLWPIATNPNPWHHPLITQLSMNPKYGTTDHWIWIFNSGLFWAVGVAVGHLTLCNATMGKNHIYSAHFCQVHNSGHSNVAPSDEINKDAV